MSCPVRFDAEASMWCVDDPDQVRALLLEPSVFRPDNTLTAHTPLSIRALRILSQVGFTLPPTLANNATHSHRAIRGAVAGFFSPPRVRAVERTTHDLLASRIADARRILVRGGEVDLAGAVADVPAIVLLDLLGLTDVDVAALKQWSTDSLELFWGWPSPAEQERLATSAAQFYGWLRERNSAARHSPVDNLFGRLLDIGLSNEHIRGVAYFLLIAGHETTSQLISTAYFRLIADPVRWKAIGHDRRLAAPAVEEVLAAESSVPTWRRIVARSTIVGGVELPAGAPLLLRLTGTGGSGDLAFGLGLHRCLGAGLARMEARVAVQQAATTLTGLRLVEPDPPMIDLLSFKAPRRVVVRQATSTREEYLKRSIGSVRQVEPADDCR